MIRGLVVTKRVNFGERTIYNTVPDDMLYKDLAYKEHPKNILELGTGDGVFLSNIMPILDSSASAVTVNYPLGEHPPGSFVTHMAAESARIGNMWKNKPYTSRIKQEFCDSRKFSSNQMFDWILVDANHDQEFVISDTLNAFPMLKNGGLMLWHDYFAPNTDVWRMCDWVRSVQSAIEVMLDKGILVGATWFEGTWVAASRNKDGVLSAVDLF
jgi:hypothetical protein